MQDYSSSVTGSSVFDFEGDGAAEVVYADELTLWVYDGATGAVELAWEDHASGTLYEYPLVVDIDADGAAEIVLPSNDYTFDGTNGITVIGDAKSTWAAARPIWNQHAYHVANVADDGGVPVGGTTGAWRAWNSFRAGNSETAVGTWLPELQLGPIERCTEECSSGYLEVFVPVYNTGKADADDVWVSSWKLDAFAVNLGAWSVGPLAAGTATWLGPIRLRADDFGSSGVEFRVDDDGTGLSLTDECDEGDNSAWLAADPCDA